MKLVKNEEFRAKLDNYWYYYKVHTFVGIFVAIVLISTIVGIVQQKETMLNVSILGQGMDDVKKAALQDEASRLFVADPKEQEITLGYMPYSRESQDPASRAVVDKLLVMTAAGDLDVAIMNKEDFDMYSRAGMFIKLDKIDGLPGLEENGYKTVSSKAESDDKEYAYGISVENCEKLKATGYFAENKVLAFTVNSKRQELSIKVVKWLLDLK